MNYKLFLKIAKLAIVYSLAFCGLYAWLVAWFSPDKTAIIYINFFGEAYLEYWLLFFCLLIFIANMVLDYDSLFKRSEVSR